MSALVRVSSVLPLMGEMKHTATLPCACGGRVRADRRFPVEGVRNHQRTTRHQEWRKANGL